VCESRKQEQEPVLAPRCGLVRAIYHQRRPQLRCKTEELETCRHHSYNRVVFAINAYAPSDDGGVLPVTTRPESMAEDKDVLAVRLIVGRQERAPELWRNAENIKVVGRYRPAVDGLRLSLPAQSSSATLVGGCHLSKYMAIGAPSG
jgi:hypothetical protein